MSVLLTCTLLIALGALGLWSRARSSARSLILGSVITAIAQITASLIALGLLKQLNQIAIVLTNGAISGFLIFLNLKPLISVLRKGVASFSQELRISAKKPVTLVVVLGALIAAMSLMLWLGLILPPTDWDGLAQNLPMAAFHIQKGDIRPIETPYRGITAYPQGGALLIAYTVLLSGDDAVVDLVQFPFWLLGIFAAFSLARELGTGRSNALIGALLFGAAPVVILQSRAAYFDVELAALALASLALLLDRKLGAAPRVLGVGIGAGLLMGLKYAGLIYAWVLLALLVAFLVAQRASGRVLLLSIGAHGAICLAIGGYWYALNLLRYGNPFWPMQLQIGSWTALPGVWTTDSFYGGALPTGVADLSYPMMLLTLWREPVGRYAVDSRLGGLGPLWFAFGLPALIFFLVQTIRKPSFFRWSLLLFIFGTFLLTPANWHTRYVLAAVGATGVCVAVMLESASGIIRQILVGLAAILSCAALLITPAHGEATPTDVVRNMQLPPALRRTTLMDHVPAMDKALRWSELNIPLKSTIAYGWGGVVLYPLFGPGFQNNLVSIESVMNGSAMKTAFRPHYFIVRRGSAEEIQARENAGLVVVFASEKYVVFFGARP